MKLVEKVKQYNNNVPIGLEKYAALRLSPCSGFLGCLRVLHNVISSTSVIVKEGKKQIQSIPKVKCCFNKGS